jgi:hypothetical protein
VRPWWRYGGGAGGVSGGAAGRWPSPCGAAPCGAKGPSWATGTGTRCRFDVLVEVGLDLLYGPRYHRLLHGHAPLDDGFARAVVDTTLAGLTALT